MRIRRGQRVKITKPLDTSEDPSWVSAKDGRPNMDIYDGLIVTVNWVSPEDDGYVEFMVKDPPDPYYVWSFNAEWATPIVDIQEGPCKCNWIHCRKREVASESR